MPVRQIRPNNLAILNDGKMFRLRLKTTEYELSRAAALCLKDLIQYADSVRSKTDWIYPETDKPKLKPLSLWPEDTNDIP